MPIPKLFHDDPAGGARALAGLRVGTACLLILQALATASDLPAFVGSRGIVQSPIRDALVHDSVPRLAWFAGLERALGLSETQLVFGCLGCYLLSLALMGLGWRGRTMALAAWLLNLTLKASGASSAYGAYEFGSIALFYCLVLPTDRTLALDARRGRGGDEGFSVALGRWLLRGHLAIVYASSGVAKAAGEQWRDGEALWRVVMRPDVSIADFSWLADASWLAALSTVSVVGLEIAYGGLVWWRPAHRALLAAITVMHLGIAVTLNLWFFSGLMVVLNWAALATPQPLAAWRARLVALRAKAGRWGTPWLAQSPLRVKRVPTGPSASTTALARPASTSKVSA